MRRQTQVRFVSLGGPKSGRPNGGLLSRIAAILFGAVVLATAIFLGAIFLAGIVGLVLIGSLALWVRAWWARRQMERYAKEHGDLNAEYTVVQEQDDH